LRPSPLDTPATIRAIAGAANDDNGDDDDDDVQELVE
jgi:hypothetical protein